MGYLGRDIQYGSFAKQTLTANSSTTVFTLSNGVADANNLLVSIGGIIQEPNVAYTAVGTVITFASAPVTNDPIFITFLGMETTTAASARDDVTYQIGTGNGTTTPITLSMSVVNSDAIRVSLNGVVQKPWTDFTASGTTLTFTTAHDATNEILVYYIGKEDSISVVTTGSVTAAKLTASGTMPAWNGSAITNIDVLPYSKFNDLKTSLSLIGFRRSQHHGTSNLDLPNGFIDQFQDQTNVDDDASVGETWTAAGTISTSYTDAYSTGDRTSLISVTTGPGNDPFNLQFGNNPGGDENALVDGSKTGPGNDGFYFDNTTVAGKYFLFTLDEPKVFTGHRWWNDENNDPVLGTWQMQGSNSDTGDVWTDLGGTWDINNQQLVGSVPSYQNITTMSANTTAYKYYRMLGVSGSVATTSNHLEIEFEAGNSASNYYYTNRDAYLTSTKWGGLNEELYSSDGTLGIVDSKQVTFSFWLKKDAGADGTASQIFSNNASNIRARFETDNKFSIWWQNDSIATQIWGGLSSSTRTSADGWFHILHSINAATGAVHTYLDGVAETMVAVPGQSLPHPTPTNALINLAHGGNGFTIGEYSNNVGAADSGQQWEGEMAQFYFAETFIDLSVQANREKFVSGTGANAKPVDFGANGSTPTGSQPRIFLNNPYGTFQTNLGSGGNFTENGTLAEGTDITISSNNMTLISESETAATAPEKAYVTLFNEQVDSLTMNTDIMAWVSRSTKFTVTATNASNVLNATSHGLNNNDRVILLNPALALSSTSSTSGEWNGATSSYTFSGSNITVNGSGNKAIRTNDSFTGDVVLEFTATTTGATMGFGFYETSEDGSFNSGGGRGGMDTMSNSWFWREEGTDRVCFGSNLNIADVEISDGNTVKLQRISGVVSLYVNGTLGHTWTQTSTNTIRICFPVDGPSSSDVYTAVTWFEGYTSLPTGLSNTAYHVVNKTANTFQVAATNGGAAVAFTDNGTGTHSAYIVTSVSLADKGDYGTGKTILAGTADITGQPTGTDVRLIVQTKNNKGTNLHGTAVQYGKKDA